MGDDFVSEDAIEPEDLREVPDEESDGQPFDEPVPAEDQEGDGE